MISLSGFGPSFVAGLRAFGLPTEQMSGLSFNGLRRRALFPGCPGGDFFFPGHGAVDLTAALTQT
ncbi:MAG: hypothetical protein CM1200mP9_04730 [Gammaproteobacteria bacterium]|nr:MAG: hypothetical protein CM1200mP9_04730 [Gammaproteobacteria bacterium]